MSMRLFELPRPVELGEGWSLGFLTAAQMLECRSEGEARALEERDKALWANAILLSRVLLKEGEPAFPDGEAVLSGLTVGQIDGLTRRWWAQDDFSGDLPGRTQTLQGEWANREGSENEHFDMARYLALGGGSAPAEEALAGAPRTGGGAEVPRVWPGLTLPMETRETVQGMYREPYMAEGMATPDSAGAVPMEGAPPRPRQRTGMEEEPIPANHTTIRVPVTETLRAQPRLTVEELDRAVERDARRYDGGLTLL